MSQDNTFPEPEKAVQAELAALVQRALTEQKVGTDPNGNEKVQRLQRVTERLPKWTPLPESVDEDKAGGA